MSLAFAAHVDSRASLFFVAAWSLAACTSSTTASESSRAEEPPPGVSQEGPAEPEEPAEAAPPSQLIVDRPYVLKTPAGYDEQTPAPLVIELHGYGQGDNAKTIDKWMQLAPLASERGYFLALPSGTPDHLGLPSWNATDACCDFDGAKVDDVAYIAAVIDDVARLHNLDRKRVYVTGISGGAFMAHRLACDLSDRIAAIVSISGATWDDGTKCNPTSPVSVVELHGDEDDVVPYAGGDAPLSENGAKLPSARTTIDRWAKYNGCTDSLRARGAPLDLETAVPGAETTIDAYEGCPSGAAAELWTARGGPHASELTPAFAPALFDFFAAHAKP